MPGKPTVFVDANVFLEVRWKDRGWESSLEVIETVRRGRVRGFVSVLSVAVIYFFYSQEFPRSRARAELAKTVKGFGISDNTAADAQAALKDRRFSDIKDALQFHSAKAVAKILVTRNKRDFRRVSTEIEVLTPEEFLMKYA